MDKNALVSGCACCRMNRRQFLAAGCGAACAGAAGILTTASPARAAASGDQKMRIRIVYALHAAVQPGPDWPNVGFDFKPVMEKMNAGLAKACPQFEFVSSMATGPAQAQKILDDDKTADVRGYIVSQMNAWNQVAQTIAKSGKPLLYVDFQYGGSGGFLVYTAGFLRSQTANVGFVASSKFEDLVEAVKCFDIVRKGGTPAQFALATAKVRTTRMPRAGDPACTPDPIKFLSTQDCIQRLKESKILAVTDRAAGQGDPLLGIPLEWVSFAEVNEAWKAADKDESRAVANRWRKNAANVIEVSQETLDTSAAMYLGMKAVLKKHAANAITINCLGGFYGGHIHAYPCLGFHELCNEGLVGACECDTRSTSTMLMVNAITQGRPGYISDPVIDTSKRQIIYAHCVASNKAFGPQGRTNPFTIMTHSEDRQGASVRSILPVGYMTTTVEADQGRKEILFHRGKAVDNDPDDRACRTKLAAEPVGDIEKLFTQWDQWGWHRVTVYGDLKEPVFALADAMGFKVIEEA
ncbi:MAG: hypothetical protein ABFE01_29445 [Phycisphaerales bacterium]